MPRNPESTNSISDSETRLISRRSLVAGLLGGLSLAALPAGTSQAFDLIQSHGNPDRRYHERYIDRYRTPDVMDEAEIERMQLTHSIVLKHYLLPSVTRLLDRMDIREEVDKALEAIIEKPFDFSYRINNHGQIAVTRRNGEAAFEIIIENRTIIRINGKDIPVAWQGTEAYRKRSDATNFAFTYGQQNGEDDVISNYNDIYLPHRIARAMELRGETEAEKASPELAEFKARLQNHTNNPADENGQLTVVGGVLEDGFEISKGAEDYFDTIVIFTLDGYLKTKEESDKWVDPTNYQAVLATRYREQISK